MTEEIITKRLLEDSIIEHTKFIEMVCKNKYGNAHIEPVIENVIKYCDIIDPKQIDLLRTGKFLPAGSILNACNTTTNSSFSNCYLTPILKDSMDGIFDCQKNLANTFKYRGGSGFDITILRPKNATVNNAASTSSGAVSFLPSFAEVGKVVGTNGRRAAMISTIDIRHPDALDFIWCKADPSRVFKSDIFTNTLPDINSINISLKLTDSFMNAVQSNEDWIFCFPDFERQKSLYDQLWDGDYDTWLKNGGEFKEYARINARGILNQIAEASHICGDPGVMFISQAQRNTLGTYIADSLKPVSSNPCGEQMLSYWSNCLLGAFVLPKYLQKDNTFAYDIFFQDVQVATKLMNRFSTINHNKHPLVDQQDADRFGKRIGIEFTGLADVLAAQGFAYGSPEAIEFCEKISKEMFIAALIESIIIAESEGPCPALKSVANRQNLIDNLFVEISGSLKLKILKYGLANTALLTIGPCGTLSIIANNCSSGIEPIFKFSYKRKNRIDNQEYVFIHMPACQAMLSDFKKFEGLTLTAAKKKLKYLEAEEIEWKKRVDMQAALQKSIDASISSTINLKKDTTVKTIQDIYLYAWKAGLKGITIFRDTSKEGILSDNTPVKKEKKSFIPDIFEKELLDIEEAIRHRVVWKKSKLYVNVSVDYENTPLEIFTKLPNEAGIDEKGLFNTPLWQERTSYWDSICRLISMLLRYSVPVKDIITQLDRSTYSLVDAAGIIKRILSHYQTFDETEIEGQECPVCKAAEYFTEGGCSICKSCGHSACG